jgi:hypothetical protein
MTFLNEPSRACGAQARPGFFILDIGKTFGIQKRLGYLGSPSCVPAMPDSVDHTPSLRLSL